MKLVSEIKCEIIKDHKRFIRIKDDRANGFGIRFGQHGFVFGWDRKMNKFRFVHHVYDWFE